MNFDKPIDRISTHAIKYDALKKRYGRDDIIPLWVADSEFGVPASIYDTLASRAKHKIYGYTNSSYIKPYIIQWQSSRHSVSIKPSEIIITNGVVPSMAMCINALSNPNEAVLIQTPVYPPFYTVIQNANRVLIKNSLTINTNISFDKEQLKTQIKNAKIFLLCNPHNPTGKVYTKDELTYIVNLCKKYDTIIISDEIHADIVYSSTHHSLYHYDYENIVILSSAGKSFNIAGLCTSYMIFKSPTLKKRFLKLQNVFHNSEVNIFGLEATKSAYQNGHQYIDELVSYLSLNQQLVMHELLGTKIKALKSEGTYLMLLDCRALGYSDDELMKFFVYDVGIALNSGVSFGEELGGYMRMNIALPKATLQKALTRIKEALEYI